MLAPQRENNPTVHVIRALHIRELISHHALLKILTKKQVMK
jgi:hypothetical protein